ncbi:hypothetical protein D3C80_1508490 [compost metagenome]
MQRPVEVGPAADIVLADELRADGFGTGKVRFGHVGDRQANRLHLQQHPDLEHLRQLRLGNARNQGTTVAMKVHQAFRFKAFQRLAHRNLADIEGLRHLVLAHRFAFGELPRDDRLAQVLGDDFGHRRCGTQVGSFERRQRHGIFQQSGFVDILYETQCQPNQPPPRGPSRNSPLVLFRLHPGGHMLARQRHCLAACGTYQNCRQLLDRGAVAGHQGERP